MSESAQLWLFFGLVFGVVILLGVIIAATQAGVYGTIAWLADGVRDWLRTHTGANRAVARAVGVLLMLVAAVTVVEGWRRV